MSEAKKVAVVTGSNKGIGYAIVKNLAAQFDGVVYLTARNEELGHKAVKELNEKHNVKVEFHQLDVSDQASIDRLATFLKEKHGGVDVLVNNAGLAINNKDPKLLGKEFIDLCRTNYYGAVNTFKALLPILRPHARVVNVASLLGLLSFIKDEEIKNKFKSQDLTLDGLDQLYNRFIEEASKENIDNIINHGPEFKSYGYSKVMLNAVTGVLQKLADQAHPGQDIIINSCCPGYVATDATNYQGYKTPDQGSETPIYLALLPANFDGPRGFWSELKYVDWTTATYIPGN